MVTIDISTQYRYEGNTVNRVLLEAIAETSKLGNHVVIKDKHYSFRTITGKWERATWVPKAMCAMLFGSFLFMISLPPIDFLCDCRCDVDASTC